MHKLFTHKEQYDSSLVLHGGSSQQLALRLTNKTFHGELNQNFLWSDVEGNVYIQRIPIKGAAIIPYIEEDLGESNFLGSGGAYSFRSLPEQAAFIDMCLHNNLPVVAPIYVTEEEMISPFIPAESYELYLARGETDAVPLVLRETADAHQKGIIYSDRWGPNTLIGDDGRVYEIDFDIALSGPWTKEFELAQVVYHTIHFSSKRDTLVAMIGRELPGKILAMYDSKMFSRFLWGHAEGRKDHAYAGVLADIRIEISTLLTILNLPKNI